MAEVICNTSPLQYLYQAEVLDLLPRLYGSIAVPEAVVEELAEGRALGLALPDPTRLAWVSVKPVEARSLLRVVTDLGAGEREVLALGLEATEPLLLLDDLLARRYAHVLGLPCTGSLGVLVRAKRNGCLAEVRPIIDRFDALGFRLDAATRRSVLKLAGEAGGT